MGTFERRKRREGEGAQMQDVRMDRGQRGPFGLEVAG
jgi:hypothetical protein